MCIANGEKTTESNAAYHSDVSSVSKSMLSVFMESRRTFYDRFVVKTQAAPPPTPAMELGTLVHLAILEPDRYDREVVVAPSWTRNRRALLEQYQSELQASDCTVIDADRARSIQAMASSVRQVAGRLLDLPGETEQPYRWTDSGTELVMKARPDRTMKQAAVVLDVKTSRDASEREFGFSASRYGYDLQQVHYSEGWRALHGVVPAFLFVVVESRHPHQAAIHQIAPYRIEQAARRWREAVNALAVCYRTGIWDEVGYHSDYDGWGEGKW